MKTIVIGFSKSSLKIAPFSWLIMWAQKTPYSHVYLKLHRDDIDRDIYYQASHSMVNLMSKNQFLAQETVVEEFEFEISDENSKKIHQFCYDQLGKPYGVMEILGLAVKITAGWIGIKMDNPVKDGANSFFCSELIAYLLQTCENVKLSEDIEDMDPKTLYPVIKDLPKNLG